MTHLTDLQPEPITFALQRYGFVYVVQGPLVTILSPGHDVTVEELPFSPTTWASYGGSVCLYDPEGGIAQFSGADVVLLDHGAGPYSAPHAQPFKDGVSLLGVMEQPTEERFGLFVRSNPSGLYVVHADTTVRDPLAGAMVEPDGHLLFTQNAQRFSLLNGVRGKLLYGDAPELVVPYAFPKQGLAAGGFDGGYVFTPDMGVSWRIRKVDGWTVFTERAVLRCNSATGVQVLRGWWF